MFIKIIKFVLPVSLLPIVASAEILGQTRGFFDRVGEIVGDTLIPLAFILALLFFFWGVAKYIWGLSGDAKDDGKKIMTWGIVALFVMSTVWGLVFFLRWEFGITDNSNAPVPTFSR